MTVSMVSTRWKSMPAYERLSGCRERPSSACESVPAPIDMQPLQSLAFAFAAAVARIRSAAVARTRIRVPSAPIDMQQLQSLALAFD